VAQCSDNSTWWSFCSFFFFYEIKGCTTLIIILSHEGRFPTVKLLLDRIYAQMIDFNEVLIHPPSFIYDIYFAYALSFIIVVCLLANTICVEIVIMCLLCTFIVILFFSFLTLLNLEEFQSKSPILIDASSDYTLHFILILLAMHLMKNYIYVTFFTWVV
jgi:hypothetical protein